MSDASLALLGRIIVRALQFFGVKLPSADDLFADNVVSIGLQIQAAMDAINSNGRRAGWQGGLDVLTKLRKQAGLLFILPEWLVIAVVLALPGSRTFQSRAAAQQQLALLRTQYNLLANPKYLFEQAVAEVARRLEQADTVGGLCTNGILKRMLELRKAAGTSFGERAREAAVLAAFRQYPEYVKFLSVLPDGTLTLPAGTTYEELAASMLVNAYGPYPV